MKTGEETLTAAATKRKACFGSEAMKWKLSTTTNRYFTSGRSEYHIISSSFRHHL
jgi:hypothetical protein